GPGRHHLAARDHTGSGHTAGQDARDPGGTPRPGRPGRRGCLERLEPRRTGTFRPRGAPCGARGPEDRDGALCPADVARRLGTLAARISQERSVSGFVATGGDGARALTTQLRARAITLTGEVAPGIPIGTVSGGPRHGLPIVTKAGGFGSPT